MQMLTGDTRGFSDVSVLGCDERVSIAYGIHRRQGGSGAMTAAEEPGGNPIPPLTHPSQPLEYREALIAIYLRDCRQADE